jgi:hypothetical protein
MDFPLQNDFYSRVANSLQAQPSMTSSYRFINFQPLYLLAPRNSQTRLP